MGPTTNVGPRSTTMLPTRRSRLKWLQRVGRDQLQRRAAHQAARHSSARTTLKRGLEWRISPLPTKLERNSSDASTPLISNYIDDVSDVELPQMPPHKRGRLLPPASASADTTAAVPQRIPFKGTPTAGRTISVALPASILANVQSNELRMYVVGQIARTLTVFGVDEIIIFEDKEDAVKRGSPFPLAQYPDAVRRGRQSAPLETTSAATGMFSSQSLRNNADQDHLKAPCDSETAPSSLRNMNAPRWSTSCQFFVRALCYLETPQYLRRALFELHDTFRHVGIANPLDAPHHMRANENLAFREGVVVKPTFESNRRSFAFRARIQGQQPYSLVDCGVTRHFRVPGKFEIGSRVTVSISCAEPYCGPSAKIGPISPAPIAKVTSPAEPRAKHGLYWGYKVRCVPGLRDLLQRPAADASIDVGDPFPHQQCESGSTRNGAVPRYDLIIGTSERGDPLDPRTFKLAVPDFR